AAGTYKTERVIVGPQGVLVNVKGQSKPVLNFCANNYLGLSSHPEVIKAGQEALASHGADARQRVIVTDGVFSMDGDVAPLKEICDLADKNQSVVDIINSTLGKALGGSMGGYTAGPKPLIELLRQRSRPYLDLLMNDSFLYRIIEGQRSALQKLGFKVLGNDVTHPICPVLLGDARLASEMADALLKKGIYVIGFSYPVVPTGKARIRVQISAAHTTEHIDTAVSAFEEVGKKLGVI
ncbi:aminotransferase, class I/II, partial [Ostertagia ostertagi]